MVSPERNAKKKNLKFVVTIKVITSLFGVISLVYLSILSLAQTEAFFKVWNDPDTMIWGLQIGLFASWAMALMFQYGQNVALYVREEFLTKETVFTIPVFNYKLTQKDVALIMFFVFAAVDGWTNIVWFQKTVETTGDPFADMITNIVGSSAMIVIVFVEELLGLTLQALYTSVGVLSLINKQEAEERARLEKNPEKFYTPSGGRNQFSPQNTKTQKTNVGFNNKRQESPLRDLEGLASRRGSSSSTSHKYTNIFEDPESEKPFGME